MEEGRTVDQVCHKSFGYTEITWVIDNYFSISCERNWIIQSPDFSVRGHQLTKWRMFLKPIYKDNHYFIQTFIERLESDSVPEEVQVKWILSYTYGEKPYAMNEGKGIFGRNTKMKSWIYDPENLEKLMIAESCWIFAVRCKMLVYRKDNKTYDVPEDLGFRHLTRDMQILFRTNKKFDVLLQIGGDDIRAHKAILCARNKILKNEIEKNEGNVYFDDLNATQKGVGSDLIAFLYTGNIDYILQAPSFSMQHLIDYFEIAELQNYYLKDEMTVRTNSEAHVFSFCWLIRDHSRLLDECIESPLWKIDVDLNFQLQLYPKGYGNDTDHMFLFGEFTKDASPDKVYFACGIGGEILNWKVQRWSSSEGKKIGFEKFISRDIISDNSVIIGCLRIICKLIIPTGTAETHDIVKSKICSVDRMEKNHHYERLSADLVSLLETGRYSDVTILSRNTRFRAHRVILSYRSHIFEERLRDVKDEECLRIPEACSNILRTVVQYMYGGVLRNTHSLQEIKAIYAAAVIYSILSLKYTCSKILQENIELDNALEILVLSNTAADWKLRYAAFNLICSNLKHFYDSNEWQAFVRANPALYTELLFYLKKYSYRHGIMPTDDFKITDFINNFF